MRLAPMIGVTSLFLAGCDNLLDLRVQAETMCVPVLTQSFTPGAVPSMGPLPLPGTATKTVTIDFSKPLAQIPGKQAGLDLDVRLDQVFVRSMSDLSFLKRAKVSLAPGTPNDALPPVPIGEYVRSASGTMIREIKVQSLLNSNVVKYLESEPARLIVTATGRLPAEDFTADVEACVFVQSQTTY